MSHWRIGKKWLPDKVMDRKYTGINKILWDQGSKFSSLLGSGIKNLRKNTGSATKKYTSLRPWIRVLIVWHVPFKWTSNHPFHWKFHPQSNSVLTASISTALCYIYPSTFLLIRNWQLKIDCRIHKVKFEITNIFRDLLQFFIALQ